MHVLKISIRHYYCCCCYNAAYVCVNSAIFLTSVLSANVLYVIDTEHRRVREGEHTT